ncbi:S1 RNA-binding domain-containing protein [Candidatus Woesearchaeota archaeon]|nr:S1 RNA-binding domain-containing protein [Candidatus Woesearchaeota archaeon]
MYQQSGLPEVDDLLVCTIERVTQHEAYVKLDEFKDLDGMVHTSEMNRRWVRNMKVFLKIGRQLVCKVMDVDVKNKQINLSIRRVGEGQRRYKMIGWKNEKRADDLLQFFAKKNGTDIQELYKKFDDNIIASYGGLFPFFMEVARFGEDTLKELKIQSKLAHSLFELIQHRIKLPKAVISGELRMHSNKGAGLNAIKSAAQVVDKLAEKNEYEVSLIYMGAPKYQLKISAENKKKTEHALEEITAKLQGLLGGKSNVEFVRSRS